MPKFETVKAGDVLYDVRRSRMGNTTISRWGWWRVDVIEIDQNIKYMAKCVLAHRISNSTHPEFLPVSAVIAWNARTPDDAEIYRVMESTS